MSRRLFVIAGIGVALVLLASCRPAPPLAPSPVADPVADPGSPTAAAPKYSVALDPVRAGDTVVSGFGPAGLPIRVVDLSQVGYVYGETFIGQDGRFALNLAEPAIGGNRLGVLLADPGSTQFSPSDFAGRDIPLIGLVIASQLVAK